MNYTLLLTNGRIIDPANGTDIIGDIGITGSRISEVGKALDIFSAKKVIDVTGKWVVPGVIDPHVHISSFLGGYPGLKMMAREGVITALDMAGPPSSVFYYVKKYGSGMNIACLNAFCLNKDNERCLDISDSEIKSRIKYSIDEGALGVKLLGGHYPLSPEITHKVIKYAAEMGVYVALHAGTTIHGSNLEGFKEAVELSDGCPLHVAHVNSYCRGVISDPLNEVVEVANLLRKSPNIWSESYLNVFNGTSGNCKDGRILSNVTKTCCQVGGFSEDEAGLGAAIKSGFAHVVKFLGGENVLITGNKAYQYWKEQSTDVTLSFPINNSQAQFSLATIKDKTNKFIVDALCTDGGGIPRNTMIRQGIELVHYGAFAPEDLVNKTSTNTAIMLGLNKKGHFSPDDDADITVLDPIKGKAYMGIALGKIIMLDGVVIGDGGKIITTEKGEGSVKKSGADYMVVDNSNALKNKSL